MIGAIVVGGKMPRVITWLGTAYVRFGNSYNFRQMSTICSCNMLRPDFQLRKENKGSYIVQKTGRVMT